MRFSVVLLCVASILAASSCDRPKKTNSVSVDMGGDNMSGPGEVRIDVPGFQGSFKLPRIKFGANDLDLNGLKLYPHSTVHAVDMNDSGNAQQVTMGFVSPADPATVSRWFVGQAARSGFALHVQGAGLAGTTRDGKPVVIELAPAGAATRGTLHIGG